VAARRVRVRLNAFTFFQNNGLRILLLFVGVLIPLAIFAALADDVVERSNFWWDEPVLRWLHRHASPGTDSAMVLVSQVGMWWGLVPFDIGLSAFLLGRRQWTRALFFILAVAGAGLLNVLTKQALGRERPALWLSIAPAQSFSFPSGHAMGSSAAVAACAVLLWRTRARWPVIVLGTGWVLLVSASRAYLGVHYPSDLVAAWLASLAWVCGLAWLFHVLSWSRSGQPRP
jgi:membrane-associated phospholipid phosphatase